MMKRSLVPVLLALLLLCPAAASAVTETPDGADVLAVFAQQAKQPFTKADGSVENLDTIWFFLTGGTFVQYAFPGDMPVLFSEGIYRFGDGGDFLYDEEDDFGDIVITRTAKYADGAGLVPYASEHRYGLNTLGFTQLFLRGEKRLTAVFSGSRKQAFGEDEMLDTYWLYYDDGTFAQYTCLGSDPIPFSEGTWSFTNGTEPGPGADGEDFREIVVTRTMKFQPGLNYAEYDSTHTYRPAELGYELLLFDRD